MKKAKFIKSGKFIEGKAADLWVKIGIAEYLDEEVIELEEDFEDNDLEDQVFAPVDEKPKIAKPKKKRKKRTAKK